MHLQYVILVSTPWRWHCYAESCQSEVTVTSRIVSAIIVCIKWRQFLYMLMSVPAALFLDRRSVPWFSNKPSGFQAPPDKVVYKKFLPLQGIKTWSSKWSWHRQFSVQSTTYVPNFPANSVQTAVLQTCIWEVSGSKLGRDKYNEVSHDFPRSLHSKAGIS